MGMREYTASFLSMILIPILYKIHKNSDVLMHETLPFHTLYIFLASSITFIKSEYLNLKNLRLLVCVGKYYMGGKLGKLS